MNGTITVTYKILCDSDLNKKISMQELLSNEKVAKAIKSEFAKGFRDISLFSNDDEASMYIETEKKLHTFEVSKDDFADILVLAEEDASSKKLLKKDCERVELVDIKTI
ncbi:hypothetical protein FJR48_11470 [Sulfurimonas lithotrophica]|uniref:Uncharacterized protein n=1 Tax=Sulfurimonas lithotrophica TaxID=2590022 RepID=A0A5P8P3P1_9BACT|nr:hypothetical protein [Sulfurimonas lithotrophica]QFR50309.1 hypothetical protein FJR48_11470 [Sulfurimonas lithotrophica]